MVVVLAATGACGDLEVCTALGSMPCSPLWTADGTVDERYASLNKEGYGLHVPVTDRS